eukprot:8074361-Pyramimonas_sp.AAC.1
MCIRDRLGTDAFVRSHAEERLQKEMRLLDKLPALGDVQCVWVMLAMSARARANHMARILPPNMSRDCTDGHDNATWDCFCNIFGVSAILRHDGLARQVAILPGRMGGLSLHSYGGLLGIV